MEATNRPLDIDGLTRLVVDSGTDDATSTLSNTLQDGIIFVNQQSLKTLVTELADALQAVHADEFSFSSFMLAGGKLY